MSALRKLMPIAALSLTLAACGNGGVPGIGADEPTLGKADAPVTMVEYASASCGHCARFNNDVFPAFKAKYIDTGEVRYTLREILTAPESFASAAFLMARCAPREKYYPILDAVYHSQSAILTSGDMAGGLKQIALSAGMTDEQFSKCVNDDRELKALSGRVIKNGKEGKIEGTPTFFIDGKKVATSEVTMAQLDKFVAAAKAAKAKK